MTPVIETAFWNSSAWVFAVCPTSAGMIRIRWVGSKVLSRVLISLIRSLFSPSRPAVSIRIRSYFSSSVLYFFITSRALFVWVSFLFFSLSSGVSMKAGSFVFSASCWSWSIAAGLWVSSPRSATFLPRFA